MSECEPFEPPYAPGIVKNWGQFDIDRNLKPVDISQDLAREKLKERTMTLTFRVGPTFDGIDWHVHGIRVFNEPGEVIIEQIVNGNGMSLFHGRFDAAAFNVGLPLPPPYGSEPYRGEPMRFVKQDWGLVRKGLYELTFEVRPTHPFMLCEHSFEAILVVEERQRDVYSGQMPPPFMPGKRPA